IWYDEEVHDLRSVETEFLAIVFNDKLTSEEALSCEPTVSPLNDNKIDFRISFDESNDEDYTVIYDKNLFSFKIIYFDDLKTDSENDNDKVNMPSFPSPEPTVSYFNDLDFFKDFENEFPAIVYNDALTSKLDFLTEPAVSRQHIDEFNLKDEISLSENIMDEVDIEDLTIEQYLRLTQENQTPKKIEDMTIAEYVEYKKKMNKNHISNTKTYLPTYFSKSEPTHDPIQKFAHYFGPNQPGAGSDCDSEDMEEEVEYIIDDEVVMREQEESNHGNT
ncbi:hypothetical protein Tco_0960501, partial [Tanacetum coccineum]